ncbi:MAG TPA: hypothetical protein DIT40_08975 [Alphaproteobacteria bacterium]|nr:hypothetical protein [Alphaproteobacteria bacterium]
MSILDELRAEENRLRGIKSKPGEGNGWNLSGPEKRKKRMREASNRAKRQRKSGKVSDSSDNSQSEQ